MKTTPRHPTRLLDELVDLTAACDIPLLVSRGTIYLVQRQRGETDFIAGCCAFHPRKARRDGAPISAAQLNDFYDHGPAAMWSADAGLAVDHTARPRGPVDQPLIYRDGGADGPAQQTGAAA